jgi:hypothetical protein
LSYWYPRWEFLVMLKPDTQYSDKNRGKRN